MSGNLKFTIWTAQKEIYKEYILGLWGKFYHLNYAY